MSKILAYLKTIGDCTSYNTNVFTELMNLFNDLSPADISEILPYILAIVMTSHMLVGLVVLILRELERRDGVIDDAVNDELRTGRDNLNDAVSITTDLIDRTNTLIEGQGGNISPQDLLRVNQIADNIRRIRGDLDEIADLTEGVFPPSELNDFHIIMADFLEAFHTFMNLSNGYF